MNDDFLKRVHGINTETEGKNNFTNASEQIETIYLLSFCCFSKHSHIILSLCSSTFFSILSIAIVCLIESYFNIIKILQ